MKILMTTDAVGGVWNYALELASGLCRKGNQVLLASMGPKPNTAQCAQVCAVSGLQLCISTFKLEWMSNPWLEVDKAGEWLLRLEREFQPEIVHLNGYAHASLPFRSHKMVVAHSCVLSWWRAVNGEAAPGTEWREYRERVRAGLRAADYVVAPSRAMLSSIGEIYGLQGPNAVIPNGRNADIFQSRTSKEPFIASAGRLWDKAKNIRALAGIRSELRWPIRVAGCSKPPETMPQHENTFQDVSVGSLNEQEFADFLSRASIFCLPAKYEPFGLSILEAALSGCALVLGDIPSLREYWNDAAIFVPPEDQRALLNALGTLIQDAEFHSEFSKRAKARSLQFTSERMLQNYLRVYEGMMKSLAKVPGNEAHACVS